MSGQTYSQPANPVKTMLPNLREEFRALMPDHTCAAPIHYQIRKVALGALLSRAAVLAPRMDLEHPDAPYHLIGTTRAIFNALQDYYGAETLSDERAKELRRQQNVLYAGMAALHVSGQDPAFVKTQRIAGQHIEKLTPAERKPVSYGFGS